MNLTDQFLNFALLGAEWVLWLLLLLSIASVAVIVERGMFFWRRHTNVDELSADVQRALAGGSVATLESRYGDSDAMPVVVALAGLAERARGVDAVAEAMNSEKTRARETAERNLVILGTLGNNAPFIGLFGTVLGIIQAFHNLRENPTGGFEVVMAAVSEALVATAVGLLVAIPAVIAFNVFNRRVRAALSATDAIAHIILGELHALHNDKAVS